MPRTNEPPDDWWGRIAINVAVFGLFFGGIMFVIHLLEWLRRSR